MAYYKNGRSIWSILSYLWQLKLLSLQLLNRQFYTRLAPSLVIALSTFKRKICEIMAQTCEVKVFNTGLWEWEKLLILEAKPDFYKSKK